MGRKYGEMRSDKRSVGRSISDSFGGEQGVEWYRPGMMPGDGYREKRETRKDGSG